MLPVPPTGSAPLLTDDGATRTVTIVLEPVPLTKAAADANRQLTSIEADPRRQKERHGFRLTARERRRQADVEARERELAEGHPEFRHVGIVTVTAATADALDEACAAGSSRPPPSRCSTCGRWPPVKAQGWVASLPLGRSVRPGLALMARPPPRRPMSPSERARPTARRRDADTSGATGRAATGGAERPSASGGRRLGVPVDWHRSTMAHLCSVYPFHADPGFGERGVLLGSQRHRRARRVLLRPVRVLRRQAT